MTWRIMMRLWIVALLLFQFFSQIAQAQDVSPALNSAIQAFVEKNRGHKLPSFRHNMSDLNGDGLADAIVLLSGNEWCGAGGCTMLIFRGTKDAFIFVSRSTITNEPIRISPEKERGWSTLIVYSKGRGNVLMSFDGTRYPLNPSMQPKAAPSQINVAHQILLH